MVVEGIERGAQLRAPLLVPLSELACHPENPRFITRDDFERLVQSIQRFPQFLRYKALVAQASKGWVVRGNMTLRALEELSRRGEYPSEWQDEDDPPLVPCYLEDLSDQDALALAIIDNVHAGNWADEERDQVLYRLGQHQVGLEHLGFQAAEAARLLASWRERPAPTLLQRHDARDGRPAPSVHVDGPGGRTVLEERQYEIAVRLKPSVAAEVLEVVGAVGERLGLTRDAALAHLVLRHPCDCPPPEAPAEEIFRVASGRDLEMPAGGGLVGMGGYLERDGARVICHRCGQDWENFVDADHAATWMQAHFAMHGRDGD